MVALLNSLGYYLSGKLKIRPGPTRYGINTGSPSIFACGRESNFKIRDSIAYLVSAPALQTLTLQNRQQSLLKRGDPIPNRSSRQNWIGWWMFRNNGYYKFSKSDHGRSSRDTVDRRADRSHPGSLSNRLPSWNWQKEKKSTSYCQCRRDGTAGKVQPDHAILYEPYQEYYPDLPCWNTCVTASTVDTSTAKNFTIISRYNNSSLPSLVRNIYLRPEKLYQLSNYTRTVNRFNQLRAWQQASVTLCLPTAQIPSWTRTSGCSRQKQFQEVSAEASRNTNDIVTASNLFGVGVNLGLRATGIRSGESVISSSNLGQAWNWAPFIQTTQFEFFAQYLLPKITSADAGQQHQWPGCVSGRTASARY